MSDSTSPTVVVFDRNVCGRILTYPGNEVATRFAALVKRTTLTAENLAGIKRLGYAVEFIPDPDPPTMRGLRTGKQEEA
jgi:hypothetical protein